MEKHSKFNEKLVKIYIKHIKQLAREVATDLLHLYAKNEFQWTQNQSRFGKKKLRSSNLKVKTYYNRKNCVIDNNLIFKASTLILRNLNFIFDKQKKLIHCKSRSMSFYSKKLYYLHVLNVITMMPIE